MHFAGALTTLDVWEPQPAQAMEPGGSGATAQGFRHGLRRAVRPSDTAVGGRIRRTAVCEGRFASVRPARGRRGRPLPCDGITWAPSLVPILGEGASAGER
ncbi:hypothetical protein GCM10018781_66220 [Kitasatospora indigofera]|uniref:Uncharacterized protein n=1 Tax=Kitasatospora indigofera TaxID=67307 RepID=A0A919GDP6_9ACTN|nr:hypothetical protein GCM10018781_66220 [Kitasatospora indigofera]